MVDKWLKEAPPAVQSVLGWLLPKNGEGITREELLNIAETLKEVSEAAGAVESGISSYVDPCASCEDDVQKTSQKAPPTCQEAQRQAQEEAERIKNSYDHDVEKHGRDWPIVYGFKTPEMVEKYLMPSQYREINKAITQAYADLVTDAPYLPWAKVGHVVTAQFGCRMKDLDFATGMALNPTADKLDNVVRAIGEGNIRIFDGLYPTMRLVADLGVDKFLECAKNGHFDDSVPKELIEAIEKLQQGEFSVAEKLIVRYEQKKIAPPIYREFKQQYEWMQNLSDRIERNTFGWLNPQSVLPVTHCVPLTRGSSWEDVDSVPMEGSLFNEDDRVKFYHKLAPYIYKHYGR